MGASFPQIAGLLILSCMLGNATPCYSQSPDKPLPRALPGFDAGPLPAEKKRPITLELTDARAAVRATLWAVHVLKDPPGDRIIPEEVRVGTGFDMTGPFAERCAGIRFELPF